jgi:GTP pyrophosphokinase
VAHTRKLVQIQRAAREAQVEAEQRAQQTERVRKMLLAFSRDLRVVLLRLASRCRRCAGMPPARCRARHCWRRRASRCSRRWPTGWASGRSSGRWRTWPSASCSLPTTASAQAWTRSAPQRETGIEAARARLQAELAAAGICAQVQGRPKHLYSIWKKMQGKGLALDRVFDLRALRVIVADVPACYAALACVHECLGPVPGSSTTTSPAQGQRLPVLHTVVLFDRRRRRRPVEVQIRTRAMHEHAEHGVAAHWAYKEAGAKGYAGVQAAGEFEERMAEARKAVLRQLLAWERDFVDQPVMPGVAGPSFDDRIYVFTPQATVIELGAGATPVDFAYTLHTDLGHRCRGARVDGAMVPLNTPLANGQTVEVVAAKEGGPSLDWLNAELGYMAAARAARPRCGPGSTPRRMQTTIARGRELVEKLLQREGRTAMELDDLAAQLGFKGADALFEVVGKDEFSLRNIELLLRPAPAAPAEDDGIHVEAHPRHRGRRAGGGRGIAADAAGALLPPGTAGRHRRLCHPRQGRGHPPQRLPQLPPHGRALARAGDRRGLGRCRRQRRLPGGRGGGGGRPVGPAARHQRGVRQGQGQRHRRAHPVGQGPGREGWQHRLHDLHRGTGRRHPAERGAACGGSGAGHPSRPAALGFMVQRAIVLGFAGA